MLFILLPILFLTCSVSADEFRVPLLEKAPTIDGKISVDEWPVCAGFEGFQFRGSLQQRRASALVGADEKHIFVAIRSQLPDEGQILANIKKDSLKAVHDDSLEVYVNPTPDAATRVDYQLLMNSLGKGGYNVHLLGGAKEEVAWKGNWQQAHGFHDGFWHFECAIPVSSMGTAQGRKTTDGVWAVNLTRNWKSPWQWSSLSGGYANTGNRFTFVKAPAPAVSYRCSSDPFLPGHEGVLALFNPSADALSLKASLIVNRNRMPALRTEQNVTLPARARKEIRLAVPANDPTTRYELLVSVKSADGKETYYDRTTKWPKGEPLRWVAGIKKKVLPLDFRFSYYPYRNRMRIVADISGMPKDANIEKLSTTIRERFSEKAVKTILFSLPDFRNGRQEQLFNLPALEGFYEIVMKAEGKNVPEGTKVKRFERKVFPWEHLPVGRSNAVYSPFTPIKVDTKERTLETVLRRHTLNDLGLLDQVVATSAQTGVSRGILRSPMRYVVKSGGKAQEVVPEPLRFAEAEEHIVRTASVFQAGPLRAESRVTWDYDGTAKVELSLQSTGGKQLDELTLEIPFNDASVPLIHANADRIRAPIAQWMPRGEGVVWDASKLAIDEFIPNFCPYIYLGSAVRGICWFAENDLGWSWDGGTPNLDIIRQGEDVTLRIHLVNKPVTIDVPRTITFGLLAAPVKPRLSPGGPNGWRYRYLRDRYVLLGTDVNWLSIGTCGSVYPAGKDLYLWEMLAKGNRERLGTEEIKRVEDWGRKYYEPYGEARVEKWSRHVRHNLRSRYGQKMIFYYNRASHQGAEEFETFKDEWILTDLRSVDKGNGIGEIKVVPTPSYTDYNLYWYARSFEIGNNHGVYWDNWFIAPSYNTQMTAAYRKPDGSVVPAAGIWAMRDLAKRTFIMLNERKMRPIVFPHMTSFNPLPMMSFSTVQYDWEWKYSLGDVQDRFSRELILLMSTGELAGVWPVPLTDHGKLARDSWTQRTFTAVRLLHELDGYAGFGHSWNEGHQPNQKLADPILKLLDDPKLKVYRYWDEHPQPISSMDSDVPVIVYSVPGKQAVVAAVSYAAEDKSVALHVDFQMLGLKKGCPVTNAETGEILAMHDGKVQFKLKKHDVIVVRLSAREKNE